MQMAIWFCYLLCYADNTLDPSPHQSDFTPLVAVDGSRACPAQWHPTSFSQQLLLTSPYDTHTSDYVLTWVSPKYDRSS